MKDVIDILRALRPDVPGPDVELARCLKGELMTEIAETRVARRRTSRRRRGFAVAILAAAAAVVASAFVLAGGGDDDAWAAAVRVARASPRLLIGEEGWKVTRADEFSVDRGEMTFANGARELELRWGPGRDFSFAVEKRKVKLDSLGTVKIAGDTARVFRYPGTNDFTAVWLREGQTVEANGRAVSEDVFEATLETLGRVDVDTWLDAMPGSVVKPASRSDVVGEMFAGLPVPEGFSIQELEVGDAIRDRYQLGAQVTGTVACAWLDRWVAARRAEDHAGIRDAVHAMQSSHQWPILLEMDEEGDYPEVLWELADAMATNASVPGGKPLTVAESYPSALGCRGF